jgi:hypothetical protein
VFASECSASSDASRRDHQAFGSSSLPPQQGGLEAAHALPKVLFFCVPCVVALPPIFATLLLLLPVAFDVTSN